MISLYLGVKFSLPKVPTTPFQEATLYKREYL